MRRYDNFILINLKKIQISQNKLWLVKILCKIMLSVIIFLSP